MLGRRAERSTRIHHSHAGPQEQQTLSSFYMKMSLGARDQIPGFTLIAAEVVFSRTSPVESLTTETGRAIYLSAHRRCIMQWRMVWPHGHVSERGLALQIMKTWAQSLAGFHMDTLEKGAGARRRGTQPRGQAGEGAEGGKPRVSTSTCASVCMWWCMCAPRSTHSETWP